MMDYSPCYTWHGQEFLEQKKFGLEGFYLPSLLPSVEIVLFLKEWKLLLYQGLAT